MDTKNISKIDPQTEFRKYFPSSFTLETPRVVLRIMEEKDFEKFLPITKSHDIWKYFTKDLVDDHELRQWVDEAILERNIGKRAPFTIFDKDTKSICGSSSYGNISFYDKRIEIGWSWLGVGYIGTGINHHAKFALLSYAFEVMKMERVEAKTDNLNERAKTALIKVGMKPEGVLRSHMQMHSNRRRDSIYYSIIKTEWDEVKSRFFADLV
jgi:RimJ/RimL family protein N-acetyltransferase